MKIIFYTASLSVLLSGLFLSCMRKKIEATEDSAVMVYDTPARGQIITDQEERADKKEEGLSFKTDDYNKLKKYSVIVATLTQPRGVEALRNFFDRDGIDYFVVRGPENKYHFIIHSSDSEEVAMKARGEFLIRNTVDKSRDDIWHQYYIHLTDTFILEK